MVPSPAAWTPNRAEGEVGVGSIDVTELQIDMGFSDFGADRVDGGEVGISYEDRPVGKRLAYWFPHRRWRFGFAGEEGGDQGEGEEGQRRGGSARGNRAQHGSTLLTGDSQQAMDRSTGGRGTWSLCPGSATQCSVWKSEWKIDLPATSARNVRTHSQLINWTWTLGTSSSSGTFGFGSDSFRSPP